MILPLLPHRGSAYRLQPSVPQRFPPDHSGPPTNFDADSADAHQDIVNLQWLRTPSDGSACMAYSALTFGGKRRSPLAVKPAVRHASPYAVQQGGDVPDISPCFPPAGASRAPIITESAGASCNRKLASCYFTAMFRSSEPVKLTDLARRRLHRAPPCHSGLQRTRMSVGRYQLLAASSVQPERRSPPRRSWWWG